MVFNTTENDEYSGKPDRKYIEFFLSEFANYTQIVRKNNDKEIDAATVALIVILPNDKIREELMKEYSNKKNTLGILTSSAIISGKIMSHASDTLGFTKEEMGGFL